MRPYYKSDIVKSARPIEKYKPFVVYFLLKDDDIIYVGQSNSYNEQQMMTHSEDKDFNRFFTILCKSEEESLTLEKHYIKTLNPVLNRGYNPFIRRHVIDRLKDDKEKD